MPVRSETFRPPISPRGRASVYPGPRIGRWFIPRTSGYTSRVVPRSLNHRVKETLRWREQRRVFVPWRCRDWRGNREINGKGHGDCVAYAKTAHPAIKGAGKMTRSTLRIYMAALVAFLLGMLWLKKPWPARKTLSIRRSVWRRPSPMPPHTAKRDRARNGHIRKSVVRVRPVRRDSPRGVGGGSEGQRFRPSRNRDRGCSGHRMSDVPAGMIPPRSRLSGTAGRSRSQRMLTTGTDRRYTYIREITNGKRSVPRTRGIDLIGAEFARYSSIDRYVWIARAWSAGSGSVGADAWQNTGRELSKRRSRRIVHSADPMLPAKPRRRDDRRRCVRCLGKWSEGLLLFRLLRGAAWGSWFVQPRHGRPQPRRHPGARVPNASS